MSDAALQLSEAKECNPDDLNPLASSFENELNDFANRVSGRKEVLEMAKNFFKCADQVIVLENFMFLESFANKSVK